MPKLKDRLDDVKGDANALIAGFFAKDITKKMGVLLKNRAGFG